MTDEKLLEDAIRRSGLKKGYVAEACHLTRQGFKNKCKNISEFTSSEINALCEVLNITSLEEKERTFFAKKVI